MFLKMTNDEVALYRGTAQRAIGQVMPELAGFVGFLVALMASGAIYRFFFTV